MELKDIKGKIDYAIITMKKEEFEAVLDRFPGKNVLGGNRNYRISEIQTINDQKYLVAVTRCNAQANLESLSITKDIISDLDPQQILLVGIAGAVPKPDLTLGDVVLSTRINSFILGAVYESKSMEYAIGGGLLDMKLTNNVSFLAAMEKELGEWYTEESIFISHPPISVSPSEDKLYGNNDWKKDVKENLEYHFNPSKLPRTPIFIDGTVDSSNFLIKDTKTLKNWLRFTRDALAVEMESAGVFEGVRTVEKNYPFLAIRGISDIIGLKRHNDWTIYACHTAAAFSLAFIRLGLIKSSMVSAKELSGSTERHSTTDPSSGVQKSSSEPLILKPTAKFETNVSGGNVGKIINIENAGTIKID